ncbi:tetratricopeptide repeat protein [Candidatus Woesearchaeota archaeon]|nr:tetratricopeptide repeat protein [Candidatus Woesearchaeota archaeon]
MVKLSLCMIVKNEEVFLEQCLLSVQGLVDEIVIVDTGSIDKTKEIALKFTSKVYDFEWCDDFAAARNESLKYATGDWILVLDADEVIAKEDFGRFRNVLENENEVGFNLIHRNYTSNIIATGWISNKDDKYKESLVAEGWWEAKIVRFFVNKKEVKFKGLVHETVDETLNSLGNIGLLEVPIHHYGKLDITKLKEKYELYEKIGQRKLIEEDYNSYYELGRQCVESGKLLDAKKYLSKAVELNKNCFNCLFMLGTVCLMLEDLFSAELFLIKAIEIEPNFYALYSNLGVVLVKQKKFEEAVYNFKKAIKLNNNDAKSYKNLGLCLDELGRKNEAYLAFKMAIDLNPKYKEIINLS